MTDQDLFDRWIRQRDAEAFKQIVSRHSAMVYGTCVRMLGNAADAEDIAQECFEVLAQRHIGPAKCLGAWLHKVATNLAIKRIRSETRRRAREAQFQTNTASQTEIEWDDIYAHVDRAIAGLPDKLRAPIVLHFLEDHTHDAIAHTLGTSRQTITYRIRKGIDQIRKSLRNSGIPVATTTLATMMAANLVEAAQVPTSLTATLGKLALAGTGKSVSSGTLIGAATLGGALAMKKLAVGLAVVACIIAAVVVSKRPELQEEPMVSIESQVVQESLDAEPSLELETLQPEFPNPVAEVAESVEAAIPEPQGIPVKGITVDSTGQSAPGALVNVYWSSGSWREGQPVRGGSGATESDSDGTFRFVIVADVAPERISFAAESEKLVCVSEDFDLPKEGLDDVVLTLSETTASIKGIVVDTTGSPLAETQVTAKRIPRMGPGGTEGHGWARMETAGDGSFVLGELMPGTYQLYIKPSTYRHYSNMYVNERNQITLSEGERKRGVRLMFGDGLSIWGTVTGPAGDAISNAAVQVKKEPDSLTEAYNTQIIVIAKTQKNGFYRAEGFPDGEYVVWLRVSAEGYVMEDRDQVIPDTEQDFVLQPAPLIEGRVIHADTGAPITKFAVETWTTPEDRASEDEWYGLMRYERIIEDEEGRFNVRARNYGDVTVAVKARGFELTRAYLSDIAPGEVVKNLIIRLQGGSLVNGTVTDSSGQPVAGAQIFLGYPPPLVAMGGSGDSDRWKILSGADGTFEIKGVSPETEVVSAFHRDFAPGWAEVSVPVGGTASARIVLSNGGKLEGTVSLDGQPLSAGEFNVVARFPDGKSGQKSARAQNDGTYSVTGLMVVPTLIHCNLDKDAAVLGCEEWLETEVEFIDGQTATVDFDFWSGYDAAIEGTVLSEGTPMPSAQVWVSIERADGVRGYWSAMSGQNGHYRLEGVPAGVLEGRILGRLPDGPDIDRVFTVETRSGDVTQLDLDNVR